MVARYLDVKLLCKQFIIPALSFCKKYDRFVTKCFNQINMLKEQNQNLTKQRELLLSRFIIGKLEVDIEKRGDKNELFGRTKDNKRLV